MNEVRVRVYNVHFGDGILITVDETEGVHRILIDVGNLLRGEQGAGDDELFEPVVGDIASQLSGEPVDLYVLSHEHLDHAQGLFLANVRFGLSVAVSQAWLTASAAPDYYDRFPDARKRKIDDQRTIAAATALAAGESSYFHALLLNNNPYSTAQSVDYLRSLASTTDYVFRGTSRSVGGAVVTVLAPEEDTTVYYEQHVALAPGSDTASGSMGSVVQPPPGVDAGAYADLLARRRKGVGENLLAIDKANNNTSLVLEIEWAGWRLLFPGDAEQSSWWTMARADLLRPIDVLKVAHHGSWNGTPPDEVLEKILPTDPGPDARPRFALASSSLGGYDSVPSQDTLDRIASRAELHSTLGSEHLWYELALRADGSAAVTQGPEA